MSDTVDFTQPFNFAQHLFEINSTRGSKTAYTDDHGTLSYAELEARINQLANRLRCLGVKFF